MSFLGWIPCEIYTEIPKNEDIVRLNIRITIDSVKTIKYKEKYGDNYKEVIQKKWDMRKLNRKLKNKLPLKNIINKKVKI